MKCIDCPCFHYIYHSKEEDDQECLAHKEDDMFEDEDGCNIIPTIALAIAKQDEERHLKYCGLAIDTEEDDE